MGAEPTRSFRIGPCLGRGGFGEVYRATMRTTGGLETEVALKVLRSDFGAPDALARFRDEGKVLARFQHPCVVRAHDWARLEGTTALVTEFVDGFDASTVVGRIPLRPALEVVAAIASALDAAWSSPGPDGRPLRIVHRDVKPTNLRLSRHGQPKLLDFGIAVLGSPDRESRTKSALLVGSLPYMAPERFTERENTPAVDVYGLGCCLFEMSTGRPLMGDGRLRELSALAVDDEAFSAHVERQLATMAVPDAVRTLCARCLAHDPGARPTAGEVSQEAARLAAEVGGPTLRRFSAEQPPAPTASPGPWTGRTLADGEEEVPVADGSVASLVSAPRETMHPDDPPPPRPSGDPIRPPGPPAPAGSGSVGPWLLAGAGCVAVATLLTLGLAGFVAAATLWASGG